MKIHEMKNKYQMYYLKSMLSYVSVRPAEDLRMFLTDCFETLPQHCIRI